MKKHLLMVAAASGMVLGARADILLTFNGASPSGSEWLYSYEVQLSGGGNLNPGDPFYDTGLFTLFDVHGLVPGSVTFTPYSLGTFSVGAGDVDLQGDAPDIQGSYDGQEEIFEGVYVGQVSFLSTSDRLVDGAYYSFATQQGDILEVIDGVTTVPGEPLPPTHPVPEASTVLAGGAIALLAGGYLVRRRAAAR